MNPDAIIAIDPGAQGAIVVWQTDSTTKSVNMPKEVKDIGIFIDHILTVCKTPIACIEQVQAFWSDSNDPSARGKQFRMQKLLDNYAQLRGILEDRGIPYFVVSPRTWQGKNGINVYNAKEPREDRKRRLREIATTRNPEIKVTLKNADALLIKDFARLKIANDPKWIEERIKRPAQAQNTPNLPLWSNALGKVRAKEETVIDKEF